MADYERRCLNCGKDYGPGRSSLCPHNPGDDPEPRPEPEAATKKQRPTLHADSRGRNTTADAILDAVHRGGPIQWETAREMCALFDEHTDYEWHLAVKVQVGALLKTIDNERDAQETVRRLRLKAATDKGDVTG